MLRQSMVEGNNGLHGLSTMLATKPAALVMMARFGACVSCARRAVASGISLREPPGEPTSPSASSRLRTTAASSGHVHAASLLDMDAPSERGNQRRFEKAIDVGLVRGLRCHVL